MNSHFSIQREHIVIMAKPLAFLVAIFCTVLGTQAVMACTPDTLQTIDIDPAEGALMGPTSQVWLVQEGQALQAPQGTVNWERTDVEAEVLFESQWWSTHSSFDGFVVLAPESDLAEGPYVVHADDGLETVSRNVEVQAAFVPPALPEITEVQWSALSFDTAGGDVCELPHTTDTFLVSVNFAQEPTSPVAVGIRMGDNSYASL